MPIRAVTLFALFMISARAFGASANDVRVMEAICQAAEEQVRSGALSGVTIALVRDQEVMFVRGFGLADKKKRIPASAGTVYRAGSISKLFTAISAMQLMEQGRLDIDTPVTNYLPHFHITVPFDEARAITLRQLMCHRAGMVRECPVGSYFDDSEPGMQEAVASLASCVLVHQPGTKTKYSNSGVTIVGAAVERVSGIPFETYLQKNLLRPLGMTNSSFYATKAIRRRLAVGYMPVAQPDGHFREIAAPVFQLGTLAAGNLYTTAEDLARFVVWLLNDTGAAPNILKRETLAQMLTPQLTTNTTDAFGLGFAVGQTGWRKWVSHSGAVYGFTSRLTVLPEQKIGVVVLSNDDLAMGPVLKLNNLALAELAAARSNRVRTNPPPQVVTGAAELLQLAGDYESESFWARVDVVAAQATINYSGQKLALKPNGPLKFVANGRVAHEWPVLFQRAPDGGVEGFSVWEQTFRRVRPSQPSPAWNRLVGSYGPRFIPLIVSIKHGHLYAMTENEFDYRLTPVNASVFKMPPGLYEDEQLVFQADRKGRVHTAVLANMPLRRH